MRRRPTLWRERTRASPRLFATLTNGKCNNDKERNTTTGFAGRNRRKAGRARRGGREGRERSKPNNTVAESVTRPREGEGQRTPGDPFTSDSIISVAAPSRPHHDGTCMHTLHGGWPRRRIPECRTLTLHVRNTRRGSRRVVPSQPAIYLPTYQPTYRTDAERNRRCVRRYGGRDARSTCSHKPRDIHFARLGTSV